MIQYSYSSLYKGKCLPYSEKFLEVNIFGNFRNTVHFLKFYFRKTGVKVVYQ